MGIIRETLTRLFTADPSWRGSTIMEQRASLPLYPANTIGRPSWPARSVSTYIDRFYALNATIYACVIARALSVSIAPLRVMDAEGNPVAAHPLRQLIRQPNPQMSEAEFWTLVSVIADVTNLCVIEKERSVNGRVISLWPLRTDWIKPIPRTNAPPDWEYYIPGQTPSLLKAEDAIVYSPAPSATQSPHGAGPMSVIFREASISNAMTDFIKVLFERGGVPQYGLIPRTDSNGRVNMQQADADALREKWRQRFSGTDGMADIAVLVGVEDVKRIGFDLNEMAYTDLRDVTELDICKAFGVPAGLVGVKAGLERNTFTNFSESRADFYERTITGLWARLDGAFSRGLLPEFTDDRTLSVEFDTSDVAALQDDIGPARDWALAAFGGGLISRHVAQREAQVEEHGPDTFMIPFNLIETPFSANGNGRAHGSVIEARILEPRALSSGLHRLPVEVRARLADTAKQTIVRVGNQHAPSLRRFFEGQRDRVVGEARWIAHDAEHVEYRALSAMDWGAEDELLDAVLRALNMSAGEAATVVTNGLVSTEVSWDVNSPWVRQALHKLAGRVTNVNETTRADIQRVVGEALDAGTSPDDLANRLRGLFDETYANRHLTVARTESMVAYNTAAAESYRASGVVGMAELADNPDHDDDYGASDGLSCAERNGMLVDLDRVDTHVEAEHPNGTLAVLPVLSTPLGEV
jgi:HK97 family phage portal protein